MIPFLAPLLAAGTLRKLAGPLVAGALVLALCGGLYLRGNHYKGQRDSARTQVVQWQAANEASRKWALAEKASKEAGAVTAKGKADAALALHKAAGERLASDYARANQCVRVADQGRVERTDLRGANPVAGQPAKPAENAVMVGVSADDFQRCTSAALDLQNAAEWAQSLREAGLAR